MKPVSAMLLLCSGCGLGLFPNKAPQVTHINGVLLPEPIRHYGQVIGPALVPGETLTYTFQINEPKTPGFDVYWPEPLPGWMWDAETLTASWTVPDVIVDPEASATMLIVDRNPTDPRYTQVYFEFEQAFFEDEVAEE